MSILKAIRWICGYVVLWISGDNMSAFLNFCLQNKVAVWNVTRSGEKIYLNMSLSDYKNIRSLRHRFGHKVTIRHISFTGFPKKVTFIGRRKSLLIGFAVFCTVIFALSQFVWQIEIVGNDTIPAEKIIAAYTELGVHSGMPRSELNSYALRDRLPLLVRDISWCSFNLEGTKLTVNITEIKETDKTSRNIYSNLIASTDGIIRSIDVVSGNKIAEIGNVVRKGDILVSGAPELNSQNFTHSEGEIYAETSKTVTITLPKYKTVAQPSGVMIDRTVIDFFGLKVPIYLDGVHFDYRTEVVSDKIEFLGGELPINVIKRRFIEVVYSESERSEEEVMNDATAELLAEIKKHDITEVNILDSTVSVDENNYIVVFNCKCLENIAVIDQINVAT